MADDNVTDFPKPKKPPTPDAIANELGERLTPKRPLTPKQREHLAKLNANRIPSGTPRGGNGPAGGQGWGGPAKGAGQAYGVKGGLGGVMKNGPEKDKYIADKKAAAEELTARLVAMGMNRLTEVDEATGEEVKVDVPITLQHSAIVSSLDRLEGKSVTRTVETPAGETVEELRSVTVEFVRAKTNP